MLSFNETCNKPSHKFVVIMCLCISIIVLFYSKTFVTIQILFLIKVNPNKIASYVLKLDDSSTLKSRGFC